jgi:hypothetical protein
MMALRAWPYKRAGCGMFWRSRLQAFGLPPGPLTSLYAGSRCPRGLRVGSLREPRWRRHRAIGPALLGSAMWIDDDELISKLEALAGACVVVTKQRFEKPELTRLREASERTPGMPARPFPYLGGLAPKLDGKAALVGPFSEFEDAVLPTFRVLGYRKRGRRLVPIVHAKLALLGHLWWDDEGPLGHVEDVIGFTPRRLWVTSANFTSSSRRNVEFGFWTEDPALVEGAERFLVKLLRFSEDIDPLADASDPDLAPVEFDEEAIAEALRQRRAQPLCSHGAAKQERPASPDREKPRVSGAFVRWAVLGSNQ